MAASTITATITPTLSVTEVLGSTDDPFVLSSAKTITESGLASALAVALTASTTPPATMQGFDKLAMSGGAATIDFRALPGVAGGVKDGNGLKVQAMLILCPSTNANLITITVGASNGYDLLGAAMTFDLKPGQWAFFYLNDASPDVASGDKTIDIAGTLSQEVWYHAVMG